MGVGQVPCALDKIDKGSKINVIKINRKWGKNRIFNPPLSNIPSLVIIRESAFVPTIFVLIVNISLNLNIITNN